MPKQLYLVSLSLTQRVITQPIHNYGLGEIELAIYLAIFGPFTGK